MKAPRLLLLFSMLVFGMVQGQHLDLGYGVTSSNFSYRSNSSPKPVFQAGNGQSVQLHYADEWIRDLIDFQIGLRLEQHQVLGNVVTTQLEYDMRFLGLYLGTETQIGEILSRGYCASCSVFNATIRLGMTTSYMTRGTQQTDNQFIDLSGKEEFDSFWVGPMLGLRLTVETLPDIRMGVFYDYSYQQSLSKSSESLALIGHHTGLLIKFWL